VEKLKMTRNYTSGFGIAVVIGLVCGLLMVAAWPSSTQAAAPTFPIRPTVPPDSAPAPVGGYIELRIQSASAGLWTVVQWQDRSSFWHDVEGWKGMLDEGNYKVWWVAKPELGKGPFRWRVLSQNKVVATSETFYLPHADQTVSVKVSLVP
jgi:hypothetical protein